MLVGKYHQPRVEDRIFLFIDLKDATECAEQLGHIECQPAAPGLFFMTSIP